MEATGFLILLGIAVAIFAALSTKLFQTLTALCRTCEAN